LGKHTFKAGISVIVCDKVGVSTSPQGATLAGMGQNSRQEDFVRPRVRRKKAKNTGQESDDKILGNSSGASYKSRSFYKRSFRENPLKVWRRGTHSHCHSQTTGQSDKRREEEGKKKEVFFSLIILKMNPSGIVWPLRRRSSSQKLGKKAYKQKAEKETDPE